MVASNLLTPGMTISIGGKLFRIESAVKVSMAKGTPFIKTKLRDLSNDEMSEKNFKLDQDVKEVSLSERTLEYLYPEKEGYLFLDVEELEQVMISSDVIGDRVSFLKEGIELSASCYGESVFSVELPQFLELMVSKTEEEEERAAAVANGTKRAVLETGAEIDVPPFVESGDVIKVDTKSGEYIQRV